MRRPYRVAYPILPIIALLTDLIVVSGILTSILRQGKLIFAVLGVYFPGVIYYWVTCVRPGQNDRQTGMQVQAFDGIRCRFLSLPYFHH